MRRRLISLLIVILISTLCHATDVYVDTDVSGGTGDGSSWANAYSKLSTAVVAKAGKLTEDINFYFRASSGTADSNTVTVSGYSTANSSYINLIQVDMPTDGVYDATKYRLTQTNARCLVIAEELVRVKMQIEHTITAGTGFNVSAIHITNIGATNNIVIYDSIVKGICSGTGEGYGVWIGDSDSIVTIKNTIIEGFKSGSDTGFVGITALYASTVNILNCTITNCGRGMNEGAGVFTVTNCALFNNNLDFVNIGDANTVSYCASDDVFGINAVDISPGATEADDWASAFTNYAANDFSIKDASSVLYNTGTDLSGSGVTTDIIGTLRPQSTAYDIGAYEFIVAGAPAVKKPRIININMN